MTMNPLRWSVVILAAGQGTRMRSDLPKVLHSACGRTLLERVLDRALECAPPERIVVVVGHGADTVRGRLADTGVGTILQQPQLGTGDALRVGLTDLDAEVDAVLVLSGDVPLLTAASLAELRTEVENGAGAALLTAELDDPAAYGRIVRDRDDSVSAIVEARDADLEILAIPEVNAGVYGFRLGPLRSALETLSPDNVQGEYYLTDVVAHLRDAGQRVAAVCLADADEMLGVNTRADLARVSALLVDRVLEQLMADGVTIHDPATTWVEDGCEVGRDAILEPGVILRQGTRVGAGAVIGAHSVLDGVEVAPAERVAPLSYRRR